MTARAGTGFSEAENSFEAGVEAARLALQQAGPGPVDLVILTATPVHDPTLLRDGVRSVVGNDARLCGGSGVGAITNDRLGYDGRQVGVAVLAAEGLRVDLFAEPVPADGEHDAGAALGRKIAQLCDAHDGEDGAPSVLLIYNMVRQTFADGGLELNLATPIIEGLYAALPTPPPLAGMGLMADAQFAHCPVLWVDDRIEHQTAVALALSGAGLRMDTLVFHGCKPAGAYHTITRTESNVVLEIDDRPALDVIAEIIGPDAGMGWEDYPLFVTLGVNRGDRFGPYREDHYANRLCVGVDPERRALVMVEPDLKAGDDVQLMRRSTDFAYIGGAVGGLLDRLDGRRPVLALYIDCIGRAAALCGTDEEEAAEVQGQLAGIPLLGFYTGVEIANVAGSIKPLDWTGVLCLLSVPA